jgi:outer membrane protein OmpA-like peptidoglycan-associated protein
MKVAPRHRVVVVATVMLCVATFGCHRQGAETQRMLGETSGSYEALQPQVSQLQGTLASLHKGADELADQVPGGQEYRSKLLSVEEVLGVADARMKWLGGELDAAKSAAGAKTKEEVASLANQVAATSADLKQVNAAALDLLHERARLERVGALLKAPYEKVLSTGFRIKAATDGLEARLLVFLGAAQKKVDTTSWFGLDRLYFTEGGASTELDIPKSRSQIDNLAQILKAYPAVKLKVAGYADGLAERYQKFATERAQAVRTALIQAGVAPARLGASSEHPTCPPQDADRCRAEHRLVAVQLTAV